MTNNLRVIDFFCGAGGFSEGFRQQGFDIVMGVENWKPAILTHNLNHGLNDDVIDILSYENGINNINNLPDTEVIIGSPPCVTFSMSNKAGKADKTLGLRLIEVYLKIIAVKKYQQGSILKTWLLENVPNSRNFVKEHYTFKDLGLDIWAKQIGKKPNDIAINVKNNGGLFTASDYGSPQSRQRFICGEIIENGLFPTPEITHGKAEGHFNNARYVTLADIKGKMPSPLEHDGITKWADPNYPSLRLKTSQITDHFYDTGLYEVEWEMARFAKVNHPFMGRMSFPEDENRPSRTIMATRSASTREALIYRSEYGRTGNGEYRLPTIREAATLMGFPYSYQFVGGESTKWKQIGNAVCPHMASALAKSILVSLELPSINEEEIDFSFQRQIRINDDLTNPKPKVFNSPPKKKAGTKFRMHPFKGGNMTVALTNFDTLQPELIAGKEWYCFIYFGSGKEYFPVKVNDSILNDVMKTIKFIEGGEEFTSAFNIEFMNKVPDCLTLQSLLERNLPIYEDYLGPSRLVMNIGRFIETYDQDIDVLKNVHIDGIRKKEFLKKQIYAIWAIYQVVTMTKIKVNVELTN